MKLENDRPKSVNFPAPKGSGNYFILDKTRVKLFSNFGSQHLIAHMNQRGSPVSVRSPKLSPVGPGL